MRTHRPGGSPHRRPALHLLTAALCVVVLGLTGCATRGQGAEARSAGGPGVPFGTSKQDYRAALADMEPVTLTLQSSATQGAAVGRRFEAYAAALEDWSGGRISVDIAFSNAIASSADVDDALADGRLDLGSITPSSEPSRYPAHAALWDMAFVGRQTPVDGFLQFHGAYLEASSRVPETTEEFAARGITVLAPAFSSGATGMLCTTPRNDLASFAGAAVATIARTQNTQVEALGGAPTSLTYGELFEGLERGVVQCATASLTVAGLQGYIPAAPYLVIDDETGFQVSGAVFGVSTAMWSSLPLAAQQLMFDRLDVFYEASLESGLESFKSALQQVESSGGDVVDLSADAEAALTEANDRIREQTRHNDKVSDPDGMVDALAGAVERWGRITEEMGYRDGKPGYADFAAEYEPGSIDVSPFVDRLFSEVLREDRPGAPA
ncbi:TRAP transporter substrate-binding protein DctP [Prauserella cavernicola]|uniref:TRAP transporter substrate-binding protein DctP n=1 Tax=Prauserella cavernicola TaxID=2800127 RepID=A0A934QVV9_9PSEU|nr:TRAP transporter substrate-binding protein DctP [Prauserella cavernicola]MBK1787321.1 TRAP transporter substrate-binding protein DctP [Prauserella cavernicola]